jgi:hypothetical protein
LVPNGWIVRETILDEVPDDPGQFVGHDSDGLGSSEPSFPAEETIAQIFSCNIIYKTVFVIVMNRMLAKKCDQCNQ